MWRLNSVPEQMPAEKSSSFLEIDHVIKRFSQRKSGFWISLIGRRKPSGFVSAVDDVSLEIKRGQTLVILGESGSGKTTLGRMIVGLEKIDSGLISLSGDPVRFVRDRGVNRGKLQMVFQDPGSSLDPYMSVASCVAEPISKFGLTKLQVAAKSAESLRLVGLEGDILDRRTLELSGGQKQRVAIARAIISDPEIIVLDEPTSSIDVSIQAQVLNLLIDLQRIKNLTYVLISHDPNVAKFMADNIAIMHLGKVVEYGPSASLLSCPKHPYTKTLLASAPKLGSTLPEGVVGAGDPQSIILLPKGCRYESRCQFAMEKCREKEPLLLPLKEEPEISVSCFLYND